MIDFPSIHAIAISLPAVIIGLTFHEYAHGWMADRLGDNTARHYGRLTLNPVPHVDPIGMLMLIFAGFGWAKPVPVNPYNLRVNIKQGMFMVALAGPAMNIFLAVVATIIFGAFVGLNLPYFKEIMERIILINVVLAIFNLIPIPPLDGSKILAGLLPGRQAWLDSLEQYGFLVLIVLVFTGIIGMILKILITPVMSILNALAQIVYHIVSIL